MSFSSTLKDLTGQKFGRWTVLNRFKDISIPLSLKNGYWLCKCECGREKVVTGNHLRRGNTTQCNECNVALRHEERKLDINTGDKFGFWTVVGPDNSTRRKDIDKNIYWNCTCKCGRRNSIPGARLKAGLSNGCLICTNTKKPAHPISFLYARFKTGAEKRNIAFLISIDEIWNLLEKQDFRCALSGRKLLIPEKTRRASEANASLDRIDSTKPYVIENVQWVDKDVNWMKQDYSQDEFVKCCADVAKFQIENLQRI